MLAIRDPRAYKSTSMLCGLGVVLCVFSYAGFASTSGGSSDALLGEYNAAMAQKQPAEKIRKLEQFAWTTSGPLRADALQVVVWEYLRAGNNAHALTWANELNVADKGNALALAVICHDAQQSSQRSVKPNELRKMAHQGENALPRLRHPAGMSDAEFANLRREARLMLERVAGQPTTERREYSTSSTAPTARTAPTANNGAGSVSTPPPADAQSLYRRAIADLNRKNSNRRQDFWELARAVVISGGSIQGRSIADDARRRYLRDGGTNAGWDQFLEAAAAENPSLAPNARFAPVHSNAVGSSTTPSGLSKVERHPQTASVRPVKVAPTPKQSASKSRAHEGEQSWADSKMASPGIIRKTRVMTGPMSLGVLIETSLIAKGHRGALGNTLVDMLRHMGDNDEAFVLSYDNNLVFEQDLTNDPEQLDEAMQEIRPAGGAKLDEAVAFAAGHLARIAKNPNRILLVISDGTNMERPTAALQTSGLINATGVRIYCIGIGVDKADGRSHLQALSSGTGGLSDFISDASQFRGATKQIAQNIGIEFRF